MLIKDITIGEIFLFAMFLVYNYLLFALTDTILENSQLKKIYIIPVGIINTFIFLVLILFKSSTSFTSYIIIAFICFFEFMLFYRDRIRNMFFIAITYIMYVMAIRSICIGLIAVQLNVSIYSVVNTTSLLVMSTCITLVMLNLYLLIILKVLPPNGIRIINQHDDQYFFMTSWVCAFSIYLLINSKIYSKNEFHSLLTENQIIAPIMILIATHILLAFVIKTGESLGYKEKNEELKQTIFKEQQYRNAITSDAITIYEFNLSKNTISTGFDSYISELGKNINNYTETAKYMASKLIHPDDLEDFLNYSSIKNLKKEFNQGKNETFTEYRRLHAKGNYYIWVKAITTLVQDVLSGEIKGFTYIKNIDEEKKIQIELQYKAERDSLTGLYNKGTTNKTISDYLSQTTGQEGISVLFIIDVDNFKSINDNFGHIFGDAVLCQLSEGLKKIFRTDDIVGRIGGDEFIAFMRNTSSFEIINSKATEICKAFKNTYKSAQGDEYGISASIGISIFPNNGTKFDDLYKCADIALYISKNKGKNIYTIYKGEIFYGYESNRTKIDNYGSIPQKSFKQNRIEYVFKILFNSDNSISAIHSVLELLASHFDFSRGYIFETSDDGKFTSNTFEWCSENILPEIQNLQNIPIENVATSTKAFCDSGMFILKSLNQLPENEKDVLAPQGIKSMLQFGIFESGDLTGFIGFDDCVKERIPTDIEIDEISTVCNVLATFIIKHRAVERAENNAISLLGIINNLENFAYIVDKQTYKVLYLNDKVKNLTGEMKKGDYCYASFRGNPAPCDDCPIKLLTDDFYKRISQDLYNKKLNIKIRITAGHIKWINGKPAYFVSCTEIHD